MRGNQAPETPSSNSHINIFLKNSRVHGKLPQHRKQRPSSQTEANARCMLKQRYRNESTSEHLQMKALSTLDSDNRCYRKLHKMVYVSNAIKSTGMAHQQKWSGWTQPSRAMPLAICLEKHSPCKPEKERFAYTFPGDNNLNGIATTRTHESVRRVVELRRTGQQH